MSEAGVIRLLNDPPRDGATNMARDEALMVRAGRGESPPTLRLYQWAPATISLGYFQRYADYEALKPPAGELPVVRRLTGGGAILHDQELTYSLILPSPHPLTKDGPNRLYELAHDALMAALSDTDLAADRCGVTDDSGPTRGPFFCFARRHCYDVMLGDGKVAGSAQRRTKNAILQHGSIILGNRFAQQPTASVALPYETLAESMRAGFAEHFARIVHATLTGGEWTGEELTTADSLLGKYAGDEWTRRI